MTFIADVCLSSHKGCLRARTSIADHRERCLSETRLHLQEQQAGILDVAR
jgi:hypothetical protein